MEIAAVGAIPVVIGFVLQGWLKRQDGGLHLLGAVGPWLILAGYLVALGLIPWLRDRRWR